MEKSPILFEDKPCETSWNGIGLGEGGGAGRERGVGRVMASNQHFSTNTDLVQLVLLLVVHRSCCREHWGIGEEGLPVWHRGLLHWSCITIQRGPTCRSWERGEGEVRLLCFWKLPSVRSGTVTPLLTSYANAFILRPAEN